MATQAWPPARDATSGAGEGKPSVTDPASASAPPLIPFSIIDAPTQRVYIASVFAAVQAYKLYAFASSLWTAEQFSLLGTFLLLDFLFVVAVSRLRTPRFDYRRKQWATIFVLLGLVDWLMTGGWRVVLGFIGSMPILGWLADGLINSWTDAFNRQLSISEHRVRLRDVIRPSHHILGQHTIHVLPYSTAAFSPSRSTSNIPSCFCLHQDDPKAELSIPIIFNNTEPQFLSYSISPFESTAEEDKQVFNITIPKSALIRLGGHRSEGSGREDQIDLELEDADDDGSIQSGALVRQGEAQELKSLKDAARSTTGATSSAGVSARKHEVMFYLPIKKAGRVRLERVLDRNRFDARLSRSEILVVACPKMGFAQLSGSHSTRSGQDFCPGDEASVDVWVEGLAPLELRYVRQMDNSGKVTSHGEPFTISHISAPNLVSPLAADGERADQLAVVLKGTRQHQLQSFEWAAARNISLPITLDTTEGRRLYRLESVRDACGNMFESMDRDMRFYREVTVHQRPTVVFENCSPDRPIELLQNGSARDVGIRVNGDAVADGPFTAEVSYEGGEKSWSRNVTLNRRTTISIDKPGTYSLNRVDGKYCSGEAGSAWTCTAREVPPPTASIEFNPIQDPCAGPVGVKALAVLSGSPPFRVKYRVERKGRHVQEHEQTIQRTREEIEFRPSTEGEVTYTFTGLSDVNYKNIALKGPSFTQVLHPVASATFAGGATPSSGPTVTLQSCHGSTAQAQVDLEGAGPFEVNYAIRSSSGELLGTRKVKGVDSSKHLLQLDVPKQIAEKGGLLTVTLTSVKDAKGCERPLTVPDLTVDVRRTKPGVSFVEPRETAMLEGKEVGLPVRFVGEGPWKVRYRRVGDATPVVEATLHQPESRLTVDKPGTYEILDVHDKHCSGVVQQSRGTHVVHLRPRPVAHFDPQGILESKDGTVVRPAVCVGTPDSTGLQVQGHFPVSVSYRHSPPEGSGPTVHRFNSAQNRTSFELSTNVQGRHVYELLEIGDAVYSPTVVPRNAARTRLEHVVNPLPFASFTPASPAHAKRVSLCLGEPLRNTGKDGMIPPVSLSGTPPFTLEYAIKDTLGSVRKTLTKEGIVSHSYSLEIDSEDFPFDGTGKWSIDLVRVTDANGCERALSGGAAESGAGRPPTLEVEVVEAANISPVGIRADYCVGETIDFVLQGSPPWTVEYNFEGRTSRASVKTTTFSRIAEQPGVLQVEAIAHQHNRCQTKVKAKAGMTKTIHALPTVQIREGTHFVEDLREGNQAEIIFRLQGEPPFSFTYQRTQAVDRYARPQVLETHTVTGIELDSYTITTAEEGTWRIIWLQDKWCAVSMDMTAGKAVPQGEARKMIAQSGKARP